MTFARQTDKPDMDKNLICLWVEWRGLFLVSVSMKMGSLVKLPKKKMRFTTLKKDVRLALLKKVRRKPIKLLKFTLKLTPEAYALDFCYDIIFTP